MRHIPYDTRLYSIMLFKYYIDIYMIIYKLLFTHPCSSSSSLLLLPVRITFLGKMITLGVNLNLKIIAQGSNHCETGTAHKAKSQLMVRLWDGLRLT